LFFKEHNLFGIDKEGTVKLFTSDGRVFYELGGGYLLYLCTTEEYKRLSINQVKELVAIRLREKQL